MVQLMQHTLPGVQLGNVFQEPSHRLQHFFFLSAEMDTTDLTADWFPWRLFISLLSQSTFYHFAASTKVPSATFGFYWTFKISLRNSETVLKGFGSEVLYIYTPARVCFTQCAFGFFQIPTQTKPDLAALPRFSMNALFQFWRHLWF